MVVKNAKLSMCYTSKMGNTEPKKFKYTFKSMLEKKLSFKIKFVCINHCNKYKLFTCMVKNP